MWVTLQGPLTKWSLREHCSIQTLTATSNLLLQQRVSQLDFLLCNKAFKKSNPEQRLFLRTFCISLLKPRKWVITLLDLNIQWCYRMFWLRCLVGWKQFPGELWAGPGNPSAPWTIPVQQETRLCFCSGHSEKQEIGSDLVTGTPGWLESRFSQSRPKRGSLISQTVEDDLLPGIQALLKRSRGRLCRVSGTAHPGTLSGDEDVNTCFDNI